MVSEVLMDDLMGEFCMEAGLRSGSLPGLRMVLSAEDKSILMAPLDSLLGSTGFEARFFIMLVG